MNSNVMMCYLATEPGPAAMSLAQIRASSTDSAISRLFLRLTLLRCMMSRTVMAAQRREEIQQLAMLSSNPVGMSRMWLLPPVQV